MTEATKRPKPTAGLRHIALFAEQFDATLSFYNDLMGMSIEWQPDQDNIYLTSGNDNLALHRYTGQPRAADTQRLDHIGFIIDDIDQVDVWHDFLQQHNIRIKNAPRTHRDGARSFYCLDPDGTLVQIIYHPPLSQG